MFAASFRSEIIVYPFSQNDSTYEYRVKAVFYKYEAWTKSANEYILKHEQLHFDIIELFARKLRKRIKEFSGDMDSKFGTVVKGLIAESLKWEKDYDRDTNHGAFIEDQQKWVKKISAELDSLKGYASTPKDCNSRD